MSELVFYIKTTKASKATLGQHDCPTNQSVTFEQGSNWFIDDLEDSYEILEQGRIGPWICQRVEKRPPSWTGPQYIGSETVLMELVKEDEQGRWIQLGAWNRVHWRRGSSSLFDVGSSGKLIDDLNVWMFGSA